MFSFSEQTNFSVRRCVWVNGPVIIGAGPSGLAISACLKDQGIPFTVIERSDCIGSLWQKRTYDRIKLHLQEKYCPLPKLPFPEEYPEYPTEKQFIDYLEIYMKKFDIKPLFNECVQSAKYDEACKLWRVNTVLETGSIRSKTEYICQKLVVTAGDNMEGVLPDIEGLEDFCGEVIHAKDYKSGEKYKGKKVLVVGCGNSGMEVALDLSNHNAHALMVVRSSVHVLPREIMGKSTFDLAMMLMKWQPIWLVDAILLTFSSLLIGDTQRYGIKRPSLGTLTLNNDHGKIPVLDIGTLDKIRSGHITVVPGIKRFTHDTRVELVNGNNLDIDSVVLATGYFSNVPYCLDEKELFGENVWKRKRGLYVAGFTSIGLAGAIADAVNISEDIVKDWKKEINKKKQKVPPHRRCISTF